jgi:hypothetical protein
VTADLAEITEILSFFSHAQMLSTRINPDQPLPLPVNAVIRPPEAQYTQRKCTHFAIVFQES